MRFVDSISIEMLPTWALSLILLISSITNLKSQSQGSDLLTFSKTKQRINVIVYRLLRETYRKMDVSPDCSEQEGTTHTWTLLCNDSYRNCQNFLPPSLMSQACNKICLLKHFNNLNNLCLESVLMSESRGFSVWVPAPYRA